MKNSNYKFLQFNGTNIYFLKKDGQYYVAIKPICEALGVDYTAQKKRLSSHPIFSKHRSVQTLVDSVESLRKMVSLPEKFIYGWLFTIRSNSPDLLNYQEECCDVLYSHFHGSITKLSNSVKEKSASQKRLEELNKQLLGNEAYQEKLELEDKIKQTNKTITAIKKEIENEQITLFDN